MSAAADAAAEVRRLGRWGLRWRLAVAATAVALLVDGTWRGNDDRWPFGPLSQFAFGVDLNGRIRSTYVLADTTQGRAVRVDLSPGGVGLGRAEVEGQLPRFLAQPRLLEAIAAAHARRHPAAARYAALELRQRVSRLTDGVVGTSTDVLLVRWRVPDPAHPLGCCR